MFSYVIARASTPNAGGNMKTLFLIANVMCASLIAAEFSYSAFLQSAAIVIV